MNILGAELDAVGAAGSRLVLREALTGSSRSVFAASEKVSGGGAMQNNLRLLGVSTQSTLWVQRHSGPGLTA